MKWTLRKAEHFVRLNENDGISYRHTAQWIANLIGCTKPVIQSMRRKARRLASLGVTSPLDLARLLLVPEYVILEQPLRRIEAYSHRSAVEVKSFLRRGRVTGRPHLVEEHERNFESRERRRSAS